MNRRMALACGIGAAIGSGWAGAVGLTLRHHDPTLEIIGAGNDMAALFDAGTLRVLIVIGGGMPSKQGALLGVFRRRVDMVVGSEAGISAIGRAGIDRLRAARALVLDRPVGIREFPISESEGPAVLTAQLPSDMRLHCVTYIREAWLQGTTPAQNWVVVLERRGHACAVTPDISVYRRYVDGDAAVIVAVGDEDLQRDMLPKSLIALNNTSVRPGQDSEIGSSVVRVFPNHPATLAFRPDGIAVSP